MVKIQKELILLKKMANDNELKSQQDQKIAELETAVRIVR